ncbi:MAG TPA: CHASE2 domain-containing protein, partial [Allocoleopsis sp.]
MTPRSTFKLKVWHQQGDEFCSFLLLWDSGSKDIYVSLKYSEELQKRYRRWQKRYFEFYELRPPQPLEHSGALNPGFGDPGNVLQEAEQDLIKSFQRWLAEGEVRKIQEKIRDELSHIAQHSSEQGMAARERVGVDIFISCNSIELARLPWEAWELASERAPLGTVRIARTFAHSPEFCPVKKSLRYKRPRILALIGNDPELPLHKDWKTLRSSLKSIADIYRVQWQPDDGVIEIKNKIAADISDKRGWDVLFFAGHSDETSTGGRLAIASNLSLSIGELEEHLIEARENGLQLAVFNSCSGLPIATKLVELGMQVVVMREPIPHKAAQIFLKQFCQQLAEHRDAHDALQQTCYHLQSVEKFAHPSAYLIPSFFSPANTAPFRLEPLGWKRWQTYRPTSRGLALATLLLLSLMTPVQDWLLDRRVLVQAMYRNATNQLPPKMPPPVLLIAIDRESINQATATMDKFQVKPMDRRYLANLVTRLSTLGVKVIGIDYFLDRPEPNSEQLANSIQAAVKQQGTWFVLATSEPKGWKVTPTIASPNWSLQGDVNFYGWDVELPTDATCSQGCPFAYLLALAHTLNGNSSLVDLPQPQLQSHTNFQQDLSQYLDRGEEQQNAIAFLQRTYSPLRLRSILDFSIPPEQAYQRIPAWKFLNRPVPDPEFQDNLQQQVVIIAT